jgi:hypothetical protein
MSVDRDPHETVVVEAKVLRGVGLKMAFGGPAQ